MHIFRRWTVVFNEIMCGTLELRNLALQQKLSNIWEFLVSLPDFASLWDGNRLLWFAECSICFASLKHSFSLLSASDSSFSASISCLYDRSNPPINLTARFCTFSNWLACLAINPAWKRDAQHSSIGRMYVVYVFYQFFPWCCISLQNVNNVQGLWCLFYHIIHMCLPIEVGGYVNAQKSLVSVWTENVSVGDDSDCPPAYKRQYLCTYVLLPSMWPSG